MRSSLIRRVLASSLTLGLATAGAVEVTNLKGLDDIYGTYAPAGDCKREPRIVVDVTGLGFESGGRTEKASRVEYAASYGGQDYSGIQRVIFPFSGANGWPVIMYFNYDEKPGALVIEGHDEGFQGGPALSARNRALVTGSPYARCK
jgi:hypothetical protein